MRPKMKKPLKNQGFVFIVLPGFASGCRMGDHSHSIVAGGLPEIS